MCAPRRTGVLVFLDDERGCAFAHDETVALGIERLAREWGVAGPAAHRFDEIERAESERAERGFGAAGDHHVGHVVADVAHRFADGDPRRWRRNWSSWCRGRGSRIRWRCSSARCRRRPGARASGSRRASLFSKSADARPRHSRCRRARCQSSRRCARWACPWTTRGRRPPARAARWPRRIAHSDPAASSRCGGKNAVGCQSRISPAQCAFSSLVSRR